MITEQCRFMAAAYPNLDRMSVESLLMQLRAAGYGDPLERTGPSRSPLSPEKRGGCA